MTKAEEVVASLRAPRFMRVGSERFLGYTSQGSVYQLTLSCGHIIKVTVGLVFRYSDMERNFDCEECDA